MLIFGLVLVLALGLAVTVLLVTARRGATYEQRYELQLQRRAAERQLQQVTQTALEAMAAVIHDERSWR